MSTTDWMGVLIRGGVATAVFVALFALAAVRVKRGENNAGSPDNGLD